jgi:hypothetical protein
MGSMSGGADYPRDLGATVAKFRWLAARGLKALTYEQRQAYGTAVEKAILAKQRAECRAHDAEMPKPRCASGTWHTTGAAIEEAVRAKQRAALAACPGKVRRARTPGVWASMYAEAMAEKRERTERQVAA